MLSDEARSILEQISRLPTEERTAIAEAIRCGEPTPADLSADELSDAFAATSADLRTATDRFERQLLAKKLYDLDFERQRRQTSKWLGGPPQPLNFPAGLGPAEHYPEWFVSHFMQRPAST